MVGARDFPSGQAVDLAARLHRSEDRFDGRDPPSVMTVRQHAVRGESVRTTTSAEHPMTQSGKCPDSFRQVEKKVP